MNQTPFKPLPLSRRELLQRVGMGMGTLGLAGLAQADNPMLPKRSHYRPRAKAVIHIFLNGGLSHVDSFDPKPELKKWAGKSLPSDRQLKTERPTGAVLPSPFAFKRYGQSGLPISEIFSHMGACADDLCVIRSMRANVPNHEPSLLLMNCGESVLPRPSMGAWVTYGLGTENQNLPGFIALCPNGVPVAKTANWQSSFLPGVYQGVHVDTKHEDSRKLIADVRNPELSMKDQRRQLDYLQFLNEEHRRERERDAVFDARMRSFELAYRMQTEAVDAFDVGLEPQHVRDAYGKGLQARQILMARRLVERGVRFVQVWHGAGQPWDSHEEVEKNHRRLAGECSQAIAALITDLKQRGMLDETLVLITGEFGRTPVVELSRPGAPLRKGLGRDHNHHGFTAVLAGGGVKGGHVHGATDELGFKAVQDSVHVHDLHATMLHLLGFDHEELTFRFSGRDFRLTDVHGHVVHDVIA